ncbi:deoxyribose-phosphate aldolase [Telmatobacter bradus]|uniref:deoxyribose-phosphate aldolase n=1 Tax=Telmatobacter bradus TaxID=474953 RepID=UPI003B42FFA4
MAAITPISASDLEFDHGSFDVAAFAAHTLSSWQNLAAVIDHTLLKPEAPRSQVETLCSEAATYRFACAMVNPAWAATAVSLLAGTGVPVGVVIGFPLGASLASTLRQEAEMLSRLGVKELDMVLPVGHLKSGDYQTVENAIRSTAQVAHARGSLLKVILETALLNTEEKLRSTEIAIACGANFVKTSTGFAKSGATPEDVSLMRGVAGARCGVKASGGIRTLADVRTMLEAGASRIGASASVAIVRELGAK